MNPSDENLAEWNFKHNPVFCVLPWVHVYGSVDGIWARCCVDSSARHDGTGNLTGDALGCSQGSHYAPANPARTQSVLEAFNSDQLRATRVAMMAGKPVLPCSYCYLRESVGGRSYRQTMNNRFERSFNWEDMLRRTTKEGRYDGAPCFLDIRWGNICNLRCLMCSYPASSRWHSVDRDKSAAVLSPYDDEVLWIELEELAKNLIRVYFAGGEPMLHRNHLKFLRLLTSSGHAADIELAYNTNMMILPEPVVKLWPHFSLVDLGASCDGVGKTFESIRSGGSWSTFVENLQIASSINGVKVRIAVTPQRANAKNLVELVDWANDSGYEIDLHNFLHYPPDQSMKSLSVLEQRELRKSYSQFRDRCRAAGYEQAASQMNLVISYLS